MSAVRVGRPRKVDALSPAERARRYRARLRGELVAETGMTEIGVTEIVTEIAVTQTHAAEDWPFPGTEQWYRKYGFVVAAPGGLA